MDPLDQLVEIFAEAQEEISPRIAPPDLLRAWQRLGDPSTWREVMFMRDPEEREALIFDQIDRAVGAPIGTLKEAWALARAKEARGQR